jgi:rubrerythrin
VVRVAFDPEAIPEHPGAQLASYGTPLVDRLLADAVERGRHARLYFTGLAASAQGLSGRVARALTLPEGSSLRIERARAMHFPQAVFWFQATFISDQKEQDLLPVAIDLHHGRQVRHLDRLLDHAHLAEEPWTPLPEARHAGLASAYPIARDRVVRTLAALANTRARELGERLNRQVERMRKYYADLRDEVEEQAERARNRSEDEAKFASRREALDREEQLRVAELRQKSSLRAHLRLINLLEIHQPNLLLRGSIVSGGRAAGPLELVWDPLVEALEAVPCPTCGHPTFALEVDRQGRITCPSCAAQAAAQARARR